MVFVKFCVVLSVLAISRVQSTCVFDSDFGFKLNCAFRKSGLFRVRNLGGLKAHVGIGFSLGDELGFDQSLSNMDNRRSVAAKNGAPYNVVGTQGQRTNVKQTQNKNRLTVRQPTTATTASAATVQMIQQTTPTNLDTSELQMGRSLNRPMSVPPFKPIPPATTMVAPKPTMQSYNPNRMGQTANANLVNFSAGPVRIINRGSNTVTSSMNVIGPADQALKTVPAPVIGQYPKFNAMPASISRISMANFQSQQDDKQNGGMSIVPSQIYKNTVQVPIAPTMMSKTPTVASFLQNSLSLRKSPVYSAQNNQNQKIDNMLTYNVVQTAANDIFQQNSYQQKIAAISKATNISVEAIEAAVRLRQNQIINQMINSARSSTTTTTTTTTTTPRPVIVNIPTNPPKRYTTPPPQVPALKVMNAPREYYPVGYEKNFDDNFVSKVDLPETSFYCGDQKHFPGLYGDEDLGCMVFHVCALTDDGLIMKSFLCPESTLFDQTILKCNWWFYVDCKSSRKLYDSNIPISKSYQLMKALTFFSSYKKDSQNGDQENSASSIEENKEGISNAVKILQTQSKMQLPKVDEFKITVPENIVRAENVPRVEIVEVASKYNRSQAVRGSKVFVPVNANEVNALSDSEDEEENVSVEVEGKARAKSYEKKEETTTKVANSSGESKYRRRRPSHLSKEVINNSFNKSAELTNENNKKHRSERASGEVLDAPENATKVPALEIRQVTGSSVNKVIQTTMNAASVSETIAKMDEAIIGKKQST